MPSSPPITATLFFLGLAYSLEPYLQHSKLLPIIGRNTKYVVYYHQIVFIIFSYSIGALMRLDILKLPDFSLKELATNQYYIGDNLPIKTVIALLAVILPILICRPIDRQKWYIRAALYAGLMLLIIGLMYLCSLTIS